MKILNETHWDTTSLRAIITRVAREELSDTKTHRYQRKHLRVRVVYTRQEHSLTGCAYIRGFEATLRVHRTAIDPVEFAWLCAHEFAHVRGMRHEHMPEWLMRFGSRALVDYAWAANFPIVPKAVKPAPTPEAKADAKLQNIRLRLALAETRVKRATTILKKWQRRERALVARMAKAAGGQK